MIMSILIRRLWIIKNRLFTTFGLLFLLPIFLNIIVFLPLKRIIVNPFWKVPFEQWIYPGLVIIVVVIMMIPAVYRDLFELRIHKKLLPSLMLTPISKPLYLYSSIFATIIEAALYSAIVMLIYTALLAPGSGLLEYLIMFPFILLFIALIINLLVTISLLVNKTSLYNILIITELIFIIFASGLIIEFEYFPQIIGDILRYLPTGQIMQSMRMALFSDVSNWLIISLIILTILIWTYINGIIFNNRLQK